MLQESTEGHDWISALVDGQLGGEAFARAVEALCEDPDERAKWHAYHVVGDVLRSGELARCAGDAAFVERLRQRLQSEPGLALADPGLAVTVHASSSSPLAASRWAASANDGGRRWQLFAGCSFALCALVIGWNLMQHREESAMQVAQVGANAPVLATVPPVIAVANENQVMLRDPHLDALLLAHKQFGGTSALQMPAGFLRNATFDGAAR